jgi:uncharacterized membrane protein
MIEVTASVEIDRSSDEVFDYLADMENNPLWQQGQQRCVWTSEPPLRVGSTYDQEARFLGRTIRSSFVVAELEPGRRIRIRTTAGTMPLDITRQVRRVGPNRTAVSAIVKGEPSGMFSLAAPVMRRLVASSVAKDYRRLKTILESSGA